MSQEIEVPELGSVGLLRYGWRQLTSMRTALILLLLLGVASIPGSLFPQRTQNPIQVGEYFKNSPELSKWMDRFSLFDVYGSPWFSAIYILLFISLIGCVLPRTFEHFHAARALPPVTPKNLDRMEHFSSWSSQGDELEKARAWFKSKRFRVLEKDGAISAEKGFMREQDLNKTEKRTIKVNSPLKLGNTSIYLQANGYSPVVTVRDSKGNVAMQGPVPFLPQDGNLRSIGAIKVPDADPQIGFVGSFVPTYSRSGADGAVSVFPEALDPRLLLAAWLGDLGLDSGVPQSVYRIDTSKMNQVGLKSLKPGETFTYPQGSLTFEGYLQWVNIEIVNDPGKNYALLGSIVAILGLLASLFTRRRRIWIRVGKSVEVAGLAKNAAPGLENEMAEFVAMLKGEK